MILLALKLILLIINVNKFKFAKCVLLNSTLNVDDYPYLVHIAHLRLGLWCSGTIVAPKWILTSATCVTDINPRTFQSYDANIRDFTVIPASTLKKTYPDFLCPAKFVVNENYDFTTYENDIALIKLEGDINLEEARTIKLANETIYQKSLQKKGKLVNFRREYKPYGQQITKNYLKERLIKAINENEVTVIDHRACKEKITAVINDLNICSVYNLNDTKTCTGNVGGPVLVEDVQIGIISFGIRCKPPAEAVVHTRVDKHMNWLKNQISPLEWEFRNSSAVFLRSNFNVLFCLFAFYFFLVL